MKPRNTKGIIYASIMILSMFATGLYYNNNNFVHRITAQSSETGTASPIKSESSSGSSKFTVSSGSSNLPGFVHNPFLPESAGSEIPVINSHVGQAPVSSTSSSIDSSKPVSTGKVKQASRKYYQVPLSSNVQDIIFTECEANNVPADLVIALIDVESNYNSKLISRTNDYGLMQINICHKDSLKKSLKVTDLLDERQNIKAGVYMLSGIVNKYSNMNQALMVYNCGEFGAKKLWNNGVYSTDYSKKVLTKLNQIKTKV